MDFLDYYSILGVPRFYATHAEIRSAYLAQVRYFHPDAGNVAPEIAKERTQLLNSIYDTLKDTQEKRKYDEQLALHLKQEEERLRQEAIFREATRIKFEEAPPSPPPLKKKKPNPAAQDFLLWFKSFMSKVAVLVIICCIAAALEFFDNSSSKTDVEPEQPVTKYERIEPIPKPYIPSVQLAPTAVKPSKPMPSNGEILVYPAAELLCPLAVEVTGSENYYIYLDSLTSDAYDMAFMVSPNSYAEVEVPLGMYEIYYTTGTTWYGTDDRFGDNAPCYKCDGGFYFYEDGDYYQGYSLELYLQYDGNLDTDEIPSNQFPG